MQRAATNHYATLGLDRRCAPAQIRAAYRTLARQHHPDLNAGSPAAVARTQELNAAYEILSDPELRAAYDHELDAPEKTSAPPRSPAKKTSTVTPEVFLRLEEFLRGGNFEVRVHDPGNPDGAELYPLTVPPATAPGTRFRIIREGFFAGGLVVVRVKARPDFRFKVRGSDLRCDLKITLPRALAGGVESLRGVLGNYLRVTIPKKVARGEVLTIANEGLPQARGGRGDLLVRIIYSPAVQIRRR